MSEHLAGVTETYGDKKNEKPEQIEMKVEKEETKKHDPATPSEDKSETEKNVKVGKLADLEKSPKIKGPQAISPPNKSLKESFIDPSQMAETKKGSDDVVHEVEVSAVQNNFILCISRKNSSLYRKKGKSGRRDATTA